MPAVFFIIGRHRRPIHSFGDARIDCGSLAAALEDGLGEGSRKDAVALVVSRDRLAKRHAVDAVTRRASFFIDLTAARAPGLIESGLGRNDQSRTGHGALRQNRLGIFGRERPRVDLSLELLAHRPGLQVADEGDDGLDVLLLHPIPGGHVRAGEAALDRPYQVFIAGDEIFRRRDFELAHEKIPGTRAHEPCNVSVAVAVPAVALRTVGIVDSLPRPQQPGPALARRSGL